MTRPIEPGLDLDRLVTTHIVEPWTREQAIYPWSTHWESMHYLIDLMLMMGYEFELKAEPFVGRGWHARFSPAKDTDGCGFGYDAPAAVARAALRALGHSILETDSQEKEAATDEQSNT